MPDDRTLADSIDARRADGGRRPDHTAQELAAESIAHKAAAMTAASVERGVTPPNPNQGRGRDVMTGEETAPLAVDLGEVQAQLNARIDAANGVPSDGDRQKDAWGVKDKSVGMAPDEMMDEKALKGSPFQYVQGGVSAAEYRDWVDQTRLDNARRAEAEAVSRMDDFDRLRYKATKVETDPNATVADQIRAKTDLLLGKRKR